MKEKNLRIKFVPYEKLKEQKFNGIIRDLKHNTIIMVDAKLNAKEEAQIIAETMRNVSEDFSGIEFGSIDLGAESGKGNLSKIKGALIERIIGRKRGVTIIGPANVVRKIKKNPKELLLHL